MTQRRTQHSCELADQYIESKETTKKQREQLQSEEAQREKQAKKHLELLTDVKIR
jgi:hypothetical protein